MMGTCQVFRADWAAPDFHLVTWIEALYDQRRMLATDFLNRLVDLDLLHFQIIIILV